MEAAQSLHRHFSAIARDYNDLRRTDPEPVLFIKERLKNPRRARLADVGCGAGRYDLLLVRKFGRRLELACVDANTRMLQEVRQTLRREGHRRFTTHRSRAHRLPLTDRSFDAVLSFNAIHLFDVNRFLAEASRILKPGGLLFIYTRTPSQNRSTLWGRFFPGFASREKRLYSLAELRRRIDRTPNLRYQSQRVFTYDRAATPEEILRKAKNYHYSTLRFYPRPEFRRALRGFERNLRSHFGARRTIRWKDRNLMVVAHSLS